MWMQELRIHLLMLQRNTFVLPHELQYAIKPISQRNRNYPTSHAYLRGMKREEWVAPIPGLPCLTGWLSIVSMSATIPTDKRGNSLRDREFSQIMSDHLRLDFDLVELLSTVDANNAANHLWDDNHVS
jgi:hypothetical protein